MLTKPEREQVAVIEREVSAALLRRGDVSILTRVEEGGKHKKVRCFVDGKETPRPFVLAGSPGDRMGIMVFKCRVRRVLREALAAIGEKRRQP